MKFVCSDNPVLRIPELPPELMPGHCDVEGCLGLWCVLNGEDDSGSCEEENNHNQKRKYCPRQFDLSAAVDLSRLARWVGLSCSKSKQSNREQSADNQKYPARNCNDENRKIEDLMRRCRCRSKCGRDPVLCQQGSCPKEACDGATKANQTSSRQHLHLSNSLHHTSFGIYRSARRSRTAVLSGTEARLTMR